jgi:hypothetical protein
LPVAETTCSQAMSPLSVFTSHSPPACRSMPVTVVLRLISAPRARALGQRLGQVGRLDVAVVGMLDGADEAVGVAQRPDLLDSAGRQEIDGDADRLATPA